MNQTEGNDGPIVVGNPSNFWLFNSHSGWDLTHPPSASSPPQKQGLKLNTTTSPITIDPSKTALVIIDMQNFFLSSAMGRAQGEGHAAEAVLVEQGIPAARKAGIQVVHITWGISDEELRVLPPVVFRGFGFTFDSVNFAVGNVETSKERKSKGGIGEPMGQVKLSDGSTIDAGRLLMRDQWNTELHDPLKKDFETSQSSALPDVRFHKTRISGFWGQKVPALDFLAEKGIRTLLFAGVNTDQCVLASIQDSANLGFDTILLKDGCGTTSPSYARETVLFNCRKCWGFVSSCGALSEGVNAMK